MDKNRGLAHAGLLDDEVAAVDAARLGDLVVQLGGGRQLITDSIDHSVGLEMLVRIGDVVERGQPLMKIFTKDVSTFDAQLSAAVQIADGPFYAPHLVLEHLEGSSSS